MKTGIYGGTGFIGSYIVEKLIEAGHELHLLVRKGSISKIPSPSHVHIVEGELSENDALYRLSAECNVIIYTVGIIREFPKRGITFERLHYEHLKSTVDMAKKCGCERFILISANGVRADGGPYQSSKYKAEEYLKASGLDWTIVRPSVVYGDPRGRKEILTDLRDTIIRAPLPAPLFYKGLIPNNAGRFSFSPLHVEDLATVVNAIIDNDMCRNKSFALGGPDRISWKELLETVAQASGKAKFFIPAPVFAVKFIAMLLERFDSFPVTRDQLTMLMDGNTCDSKKLFKELSLDPKIFSLSTLSYLKR